MIWTLLASPICQQLVRALAHFVWQGAVIAAALAMILALVRPRSPATRYALALAALLLMAACLPVTFWWCSSTSSSVNPVAEPVATAASEPAWIAQFEALQPALMLVWLVGVSLLGLRLLAGAMATWRLRQGVQPIAFELERRLMRLGRKLGVRTVGRVFASGKVQVATAVGFLRPIVLLPVAWLAELPPAAIEAIVAHELAHIRRWDLWATLLQRVVETLLFYHPAVWWASRFVEQERELCCDELAVAATGERLVYVRTLAAVASAPLAPAALAVSITGERKMQLLNRVRHVLGTGAKPARAGWWPVGLVLVSLPVLMWLLAAGIPNGTRALADAPREGEARERGDRERGDREGGDRESPEAKAARGKKEGERKADREKSDEQGGLEDFKPKNEREAQLLKKIRALESELKQLRSTNQGTVLIPSKDGTLVFDGGTLRFSGITVDVTQGKPPTKDARPKKDGDITVSTGTFKLGAATVDTKVTVGATTQPTKRDGDQPKTKRDGDQPKAKRDRKDGEKPGPKDGDGSAKKGPRDGDQPRTGPKDGDAPREKPRDG